MLLVICTLALFSFTKKEALKDAKALNANQTSGRFWGWGCPICTVINDGSVGTINYTCTSVYFVFGVAVSSNTTLCSWNQATQGNLIQCAEQTNQGNLICAASTIGTD